MKFRRNSLIVILSLCISLSGCINSSLPNGKSKFPYDLMVNLNDLTTQFTFLSGDFPSVDNAISYEVKYKNRNDEPGAIFFHQITIYPDTKSARDAYSTWDSSWFNEYWSQPFELTYKPKDSNDNYKLECLDENINGSPTRSCRLLQLHNNIIILILSNISEENISFLTFESILKKLDSRLPNADVPMPSQ